MNKILLMTDSASDISLKTEKELGSVKILNIPLTINNQGYYDRQDFTAMEFYKILGESSEIPATAHITAPVFCDEFTKVFKEGYEDLIYVSINEKGSATYQASIQGRDMFFEEHPEAVGKLNIHLIPSRTYSYGYGMAVVNAAGKLKENENITASELVEFIQKELTGIDIYFSMYTLKFAKKSGRLSATAAFVGEMLGIRPCITFRGGENVIAEKIRGDKNIVPAIGDYYLKNFDEENDEYYILTGEDEDSGDELEEYIAGKTGRKAAGRIKVGCAIAINSGPKVVAIGFHNKNKTEL